MLYDIIIGGLFGFGTYAAIGPLKDATKDKIALDERELHILTFGAMMLLAALLGPLIAGRMSPFWLVLGGLIGIFGERLYGWAVSLANGKSANAKADDIEDAVVETVDEAGKENP
ncbi:MAG: hypothetical protein AAFQ64_12775 [Pseudomonadota bacterium]